MFPSRCCTWAALLILVVLATIAMADQEEKHCDLVGDKATESKREQALLKKLEPLSTMSFEKNVSSNPEEQYTYKFKVCGEVSKSMPQSGLVQINLKDQKQTVVGRINETQVFNGSDWIMLIYKGDSYGSHCHGEKRKAMIMISCNRKTLADGFTLLSEEREKEQDCLYLFEMDSRLACPPEDSHLSIGSILLIMFASLVAVYIIGGFLYQRLVVGAKGMEQFPHFTFWQDLGNLMADGCDFVCRSKPQNAPAAYRGVGDDQLGEESEERDDHLLPM